MMTIETPAGPVEVPAPPAQWIGDEMLAADTVPVPVLGAHTRAVRAEFLG